MKEEQELFQMENWLHGVNNPYAKKVIQEFYNFGAPEQILYTSKPHIGTDILRKVIVNMRNKIISLGGRFSL